MVSSWSAEREVSLEWQGRVEEGECRVTGAAAG